MDQSSNQAGDAEMNGIAALLVVNAVIIIGVITYVLISHKWDRKSGGEYGEQMFGERITKGLFLDDQSSQIESLLTKEDPYFPGGVSSRQGQPMVINSLASIGPRAEGPQARGSLNSRLNSVYNSGGASSSGASAFGLIGSRKPFLATSQDDADEQNLNNRTIDVAVVSELLTRPKGWSQLMRTLWHTDEQKLLKFQNPDGYFYLHYLKLCSYFFAIVTALNLMILIPSYTIYHDVKFSYILEQISSPLDKLTLSDSLQNPQIIHLIMILTLLYSMLAAYFIVLKLAQEMSQFEFPPSQQYLDNFISQHSIMIRGINQKIGVSEASIMIRRVFEERFGDKQVVAVQVVGRTDNIQQLLYKRDTYRNKYEQCRTNNQYQERKTIKQGSKLLCCLKREIDAELYYKHQLEKVSLEWEGLRCLQKSENTGVAFVSFRDKNCVGMTIDEIDTAKAKLEQHANFEELNLSNWEVEDAIPVSDIIWTQINQGRSTPYIVQLLISVLVPLSIALISVTTIIYIDQNISDISLSIVAKYLCPLALAAITLMYFPQLIFTLIHRTERIEMKSVKESSTLCKTVFYMVLTSAIVPILAAIALSENSLEGFQPYNFDEINRFRNNTFTIQARAAMFSIQEDNHWNELAAVSIAFCEEYVCRYALHMALLLCLCQVFLKGDVLLKYYNQTIQNGGNKNKFNQWFFDIGFKKAVAISFFTFCLIFSVVIPILSPLAMALFSITYYIDKYNIIYVYPVGFESKIINRRALLVYSIAGIILFQIIMLIIGATVLTKQVCIYLFAFLIVEIVGLTTYFEFIRKPWEGKELEQERIIQENQNNIFDSISSFGQTDLGFEGGLNPSSFLASTSPPEPKEVIQQHEYEAQTHAEKIRILLRAYENPFDVHFRENGDGEGFVTDFDDDGRHTYTRDQSMNMRQSEDGGQFNLQISPTSALIGQNRTPIAQQRPPVFIMKGLAAQVSPSIPSHPHLGSGQAFMESSPFDDARNFQKIATSPLVISRETLLIANRRGSQQPQQSNYHWQQPQTFQPGLQRTPSEGSQGMFTGGIGVNY